jgi:hypothetical protein
MAKVVALVDEISPPKVLMNDPKIMTDEASQKVILEMPRKSDLQDAINRGSLLHTFASLFKICDGWRPQETIIAKLMFSKTSGKACVGLQFALKKVLAAPTTGPAAIKACGESIRETIKRKGHGKSWKLPVFLEQLIDTMCSIVVPEEAKAPPVKSPPAKESAKVDKPGPKPANASVAPAASSGAEPKKKSSRTAR